MPFFQQAYKGLAHHIKNEMVHHDRPITLLELHKLVQAINYCYWEWKAEITREANPASKVDPKGDPKITRNPKATAKGKAPENPKSGPDLTGKLGKDSKLTPQECCMDNSLCLFCRKTGHIAKEYPKSTAIAARACAAITKLQESPSLRRQKKIKQPPAPRTPRGLHITRSCTNYCHSQCLHHYS